MVLTLSGHWPIACRHCLLSNSCLQFCKKVACARLCSNRAWWPLAPKFCSWATRKSYFFHTNHVLGTLDFTGSEHWAPFNFP